MTKNGMSFLDFCPGSQRCPCRCACHSFDDIEHKKQCCKHQGKRVGDLPSTEELLEWALGLGKRLTKRDQRFVTALVERLQNDSRDHHRARPQRQASDRQERAHRRLPGIAVFTYS